VPTPDFRRYIAEKVEAEFDGFFVSEGIIGSAVDETTGQTDSAVTAGGLLDIYGLGLKVSADLRHMAEAGVFFEAPDLTRIRAKAIAVNEPRRLKVIAPSSLVPGTAYELLVVTQSSAAGSSSLLKNPREVRSDFTLKAQN
jgi:hypothetical protein